MLNWGIHNGSKEHKVKAKSNLTLMLFYDPTKGGITFRIPKWVRFPLLAAAIAIVLGVLSTMSYIAELESQLAYEKSEVKSSEMVIIDKDSEITDLQETDTKRYDQLKALSTLTLQLQGELNNLKEYKEVIDEKLGSTDKTTDAQPSRMSTVTKASDVVVLSSEEDVMDDEVVFKTSIMQADPLTEEVQVMQDDFSDEVDRLLEELNGALAQIDGEVTSYEDRDQQIDEILPFWDAYPSVIPVADTYITSPYGYRRNPFGRGGYEFHSGVDFKAYYQDVWATGEGVVTYSGYNSGYGYMVIIDHGYGIITKYAHNSKLYVEEGDQVSRYDVIARSGNSGRSSGPHLHYEIIQDGENMDPMDFIYKGEEE